MSRLYAPLTVGRVFVALMFAAYLVGLAPHLVHHLLEHDQAQPDCPFAMAAERQHASAVPDITPLPAPVATSSVVAPPAPAPRDLSLVRIDARGPPAAA